MSTSNFAEACGTYKLLREKGYPEKATLKLVGDRHRLSRIQRNCIFRGVTGELAAARRKAKIVAPDAVSGRPLGLDWYNVLITVESYLRGQVLFLGDDGMVRDASAAHGSYRTAAHTSAAIEEIVREIARLETRPARCIHRHADCLFRTHGGGAARAADPTPLRIGRRPGAERRLSPESVRGDRRLLRFRRRWRAAPRCSTSRARYWPRDSVSLRLRFMSCSRNLLDDRGDRPGAETPPASRRMAAFRDSPAASRRARRTSSSWGYRSRTTSSARAARDSPDEEPAIQRHAPVLPR